MDITFSAEASDASVQLNELAANFHFRFITNYKKRNFDFLTSLCDKYGSDKGSMRKSGNPYPWPAHTYTDFYSRLFDHCRLSIKKVFECGIGTNNPGIPCNMGIHGRPGASLRVWRDYFPNAQIIGGDIDRDILFEEERIRTYYLDQTKSESVGQFWSEVEFVDFDLIIDDGLHDFEAGVCLFENSISRLSNSGIYIIEDINAEGLLKYQRYFRDTEYQVDYVNLLRPEVRTRHNNLVIIRR